MHISQFIALLHREMTFTNENDIKQYWIYDTENMDKSLWKMFAH